MNGQLGNGDFEEAILSLIKRVEPLQYSKISRSEEESIILKFKECEQSGEMEYGLFDVLKSDLPDFLRPYYFVDAEVRFPGGSTFKPALKPTRGSGVGDHVLSASCHALGEALERHLGFLGGTKDARPSKSAVFSLAKKDWVDLGFDPFDSNPASNPFFSPDGLACHPRLEEAFRNAMGELLERNFIATVDCKQPWLNVTESLISKDGHAKASQAYWENLGYSFAVYVALHPLGGFVSVATVVRLAETFAGQNSHDGTESQYGASFRGSAADFALDYAPMQAISELNRSAHFGPYLRIHSDLEARQAQSALSKEDYYYGYLERLMQVDWLHTLAASNSPIASLPELRLAHSASPRVVIGNLVDRFGDVFVIPYANPASSGMYGVKFAVPGCNTSAVSRIDV